MDRLESMSILLAAVDAGSLSAASRKLAMPLATVSRKVSELEAHLRTRLVNRTSRRLTLTQAGRSYVAACRQILAAVDAAIAAGGITRVLSYQAAKAVRAGTLAVALRDFEPKPSPVSLLYVDQRLLPLKLRAFLDFTAPRLRDRLHQNLD